MGEEAQFIARYGKRTITGHSFTEVGDVLAARGFDMVKAEQTDHGVLLIPHRRRDRMAARLYHQLPAVKEEPKHNGVEHHNGVQHHNGDAVTTDAQPVAVGGAASLAEPAEAKPIVGLQTCECGAVHPDGLFCMIPVLYEKRCCLEHSYAHAGPHEAGVHDPETDTVVITHRWIEELVITDLPFTAYKPLTDEEREEI
jgi:hypothetical protein